MKWAKTSGTKRHKTHHDLISRCCAQRHLVRTLIELTDETKKKGAGKYPRIWEENVIKKDAENVPELEGSGGLRGE